jgi:hypothetical protein
VSWATLNLLGGTAVAAALFYFGLSNGKAAGFLADKAPQAN